MRAVTVFRDKTSLAANPALWPSIEQALSNAAYFILLASPEAAHSAWVQKELTWWLDNRPAESMLIVLTSGDIEWDEGAADFDWGRTTALPPLLRKRFRDVPLFVDLRWAKSGEVLSLRHPQFRAAVLDLAAVLHGKPKDELDGEDVKQHRTTRTAIWAAVVSIAAFAVLAAAQWRIAGRERDEAIRQRNLAVSRELAVSSSVQIPVDPELATLLAVEALRVAHTSEAEGMLRRAVLQLQTRTTIRGHTADVVDAQFSADGRVLMTRDSTGLMQLNDVASGQRISSIRGVVNAVFRPNSDSVLAAMQNGTLESYVASTGARSAAMGAIADKLEAMLFSRGGERLLTLHSDGTAHVRDARTGSVSASVTADGHRIVSADFSPDGKLVLTASDDKTARLSDAASGRTLRAVDVGEDLASARFSPDGRWFVAITQAGYGEAGAAVYDTATMRQAFLADNHEKSVTSAVFSPDSRLLVTTSYDRMNVWDLERKRNRHTFLPDERGGGMQLLFSPDSTLLATYGGSVDSILWNTRSWREEGRLRTHSYGVAAASFHPMEALLVTGGANGSVRLWDSVAGAELEAVDLQSIVSPVSVVSASGKLIAIGRGPVTDVVDTSNFRRYAVLKGHVQPISHLAFSPSDRLLATASSDGAARVWRAGSWTQSVELRGHSGPVLSIAFSPDEKLVVTGSQDGAARVWDANTGRLLKTLGAGMRGVYGVQFKPGGRFLMTEGVPETIVWSTLSWERADPAMVDMQFSPDGRMVAEIDGNRIHVHPAGEQSVVFRLEGHTRDITRVLYSPDGGRIVTASQDGTARVWDAGSGQARLVLGGHTKPVTDVVFGPGGKTMATLSDDLSVGIWDSETGARLTTLRGLGSRVDVLRFSADGKAAATSGGGGVKLWNLTTGGGAAVGAVNEGQVAGFSPDGALLLTTAQDHSRVWAVTNGALVAQLAGGQARFSANGSLILTESRIYPRVSFVTAEEVRAGAMSAMTRGLTEMEKKLYLHQ